MPLFVQFLTTGKYFTVAMVALVTMVTMVTMVSSMFVPFLHVTYFSQMGTQYTYFCGNHGNYGNYNGNHGNVGSRSCHGDKELHVVEDYLSILIYSYLIQGSTITYSGHQCGFNK